MNLSKLWEIAEDTGAWCAAVSVQRIGHNLATEWNNVVVLGLIFFFEKSLLFSTEASFYIPTSDAQGFQFL